MPYATPADLYVLASESRLRKMIPDAPEDLDAVVTEQIAAASMEIDLAIGGQCSTPVDTSVSTTVTAPFLAWIKRLAIVIAWHNISASSGANAGPMKEEYGRIRTQLDAIRDQKSLVPATTNALRTKRRVEAAFSTTRALPTSLFDAQRATAGEH